jgi:hypothetical protein
MKSLLSLLLLAAIAVPASSADQYILSVPAAGTYVATVSGSQLTLSGPHKVISPGGVIPVPVPDDPAPPIPPVPDGLTNRAKVVRSAVLVVQQDPAQRNHIASQLSGLLTQLSTMLSADQLPKGIPAGVMLVLNDSGSRQAWTLVEQLIQQEMAGPDPVKALADIIAGLDATIPLTQAAPSELDIDQIMKWIRLIMTLLEMFQSVPPVVSP